MNVHLFMAMLMLVSLAYGQDKRNIRIAGIAIQVQIESPKGMCPFLVETDENNERLIGRSVQETVEILTGCSTLRSSVR